MITRVEINEAHLGHFAHREDAETVIAFLRGLGWNAVYTDNQHGSWRFATRREENAFGINLDQALEGLGHAGSINVRWGCSCAHDARCTCGEEPDLQNLYGSPLRQAIEAGLPLPT